MSMTCTFSQEVTIIMALVHAFLTSIIADKVGDGRCTTCLNWVRPWVEFSVQSLVPSAAFLDILLSLPI